MPPLVVFGLLLGAGYYSLALGAFFLFLANLISVNLAGVAIFLAQGIEPRTWWDAKKAKTSHCAGYCGLGIIISNTNNNSILWRPSNT